jgi:hypothetical protein
MKNYSLLSLSLFILFLISCQVFSPITSPTPTVDLVNCAAQTDPTQADIDFSLNFGDAIFSEESWTRAYTVEPQRVSVSWTSETHNSVAYLSYLIFSCGTTAGELDAYFNEPYWPILFQNYETYEPADSCGSFTSLKLWEFTAVSSENDYQVRYWVRQENATRVLTLFFVYPPESASLMNTYTTKMFPEFEACK